MITPHHRARQGLLFGLGAYGLWGGLPVYFKLLADLPPSEIVAHRILWSLIFIAALATLMKRWRAIAAAIRTPRVLPLLLASAALIGGNWLVYIWAVLNGHVLEGSLGYYLNPLVTVLFGVLFFKERLTRVQVGAVALAGAGVALLAVGAGEGLWISLVLAGTFACYGFIRKIAPVDSLEGLAIETTLLAPAALGWLLWVGEGGSFPADPATNALVVLSGAVTAVPLLLFAAAAKRLPFSTLGLLQYIGPSTQFLLAILVFDETLTRSHILCFAAIWTALAIFAVDGVRTGRAARRARDAKAAACVEPCAAP